MIFVLRLANSGWSPAMYPSSVVHTGVKSFGCENRIAHPSPIHSWRLIVPCVVSAVKFGASSFIRNDMVSSLHSGFGSALKYTLKSKSDTIALDGSRYRHSQLQLPRRG